MSLTDTYDRLASEVEAQLLAAYKSWAEGLISLTDFLAVATAYLSAGSNRATALADTALAAYLTKALSKPIPTLGLLPPATDHRPELATLAARDDIPDPGPRFGRHGRAITLAAAQDAYGLGMTERGVAGWTRVLNSGACELCRDLAGDVLPGDAPMYHHLGCGCTQKPVLTIEGNTK